MKLNAWNAFIVCTNIYEEWLSLCTLEWKYVVPNTKSYYSMIILYVLNYKSYNQNGDLEKANGCITKGKTR